MVGTKITRQRMENQILSTKITHQRFEQYKNNSPKGWVAQKQPVKGMDGWRVKWSA